MGTTAPAPTERYISLQEAVDEGYGAYSTIRMWIDQGKIPAVKAGRRVKIRRSDLEKFVHPIEVSPRAAEVSLARAVENVVAAAPRLSTEQIARLREVLGGDAR